MENIYQALIELAKRGDVEIVYPVHLNPNVQEPVNRLLKNIGHITLLPPLDYLPLVHLMKHAALILTDSGGIQEEAPAFGIPTLVLRDVTEIPFVRHHQEFSSAFLGDGNTLALIHYHELLRA